jgi:predicted Rossmann-fold nucleotide-binding protein
MIRKLPIIGVFGRGSPIAPQQAALARAVGALVARLGAHLLTGAGFGVMAAAAEGFVAVEPRAGLSIGVVPRDRGGPFDRPIADPDGRPYPNPFVEIAVHTPLLPEVEDWRETPTRNHVNVLTAHAIAVLAGDVGTRNELDMAAVYCGEAARRREDRRTVLVGPEADFTAAHRELFVRTEDMAEVEQHLQRILAMRDFSVVAKALT